MEYANKNSIPSLNISFPWPSSSSYLLLPGTPPPPSKPFMICQQEVFVSHLLAPFSFYHLCHFHHFVIIDGMRRLRRRFVGISSAFRRRIVGACRRFVGASSALRRRLSASRWRLSAPRRRLSAPRRRLIIRPFFLSANRLVDHGEGPHGPDMRMQQQK